MVESILSTCPSSGSLEVNGVIVPLDPSIITPVIRNAILDGRFEAEEARHIPKIVRPGDQVLEIGAGIGFISTLLSREPRVSNVIAVEANPLLMDYMADLHHVNGVRKVRRVNAVLSNGPETEATFYLRQDFWMGSLMSGPNAYYGTVRVPTANLNGLLRDEGVNLIVCDVEGAETFLFDDADLSGVDRIFLELHDHVTGMLSIGRLFATLAAQGFIYDPRHSEGSVILFRKIDSADLVRDYGT